MSSINLSKILLKGEVLSLLRGLITTLAFPISIQDQKGEVLVADLGFELEKATKFEVNHDLNSNNVSKIPVLLDEEVLGWVIGAEKTKQVADFLNYIVKREFERKTLAADTLDNYREMSLLYMIAMIASKMSNCLDAREIGSLVIEEASRLIKCTSASVMLYNQHDNSFEIIAAKGTAERIGSLKLAANQGIAGYVFSTGNPELVNDATKDPRYIVNEIESYALICAPILTKDRILGVVNISNSESISYTPRDLKLFTAIVTQASRAIENALLHASKLQEERIKNNLERYLLQFSNEYVLI